MLIIASSIVTVHVSSHSSEFWHYRPSSQTNMQLCNRQSNMSILSQPLSIRIH